MTTEPDLAAWLLEQIEKDELDAKEMAIVYPTPWEVSDRGWMVRITADEPDFREVLRLEQWPDQPGGWLGGFVQHVDNWNPARALAECDAKRRLVDLHEPVNGHCSTCLESESDLYGKTYETAPCMNLRLLAVPFADRPGYREEWRP